MQNSFSLLTLFTSGDLMVLTVSVLLVIGSIISWVIVIEKLRRWHFEKRNRSHIKPGDNIKLAADRIIEPFDKNLWFLSMASVVAPFIGLFGTIWGIMNSFAAIGVNQSTSIGVIAPGLAAALGTTALGLLVAIPAAIFYQYFSRKADDLYNRLDMQCREIENKK